MLSTDDISHCLEKLQFPFGRHFELSYKWLSFILVYPQNAVGLKQEISSVNACVVLPWYQVFAY